MANKIKRKKVLSWIAVGISTLISCIWAFWGIIENFHEGWYYDAIWMNLGLMFAQYLSPMLIFVGLAALSIFKPKIGAILHGLIAALAVWFFRSASPAAILLIIIPLLSLGAFYWFSHLEKKKLAALLAIGLPLFVVVICGISPAIRVSQRLNDGILEARLVHGNGVDLIWAPDGPGWPDQGDSWTEANQACRLLTEDGLRLAEEFQDIWRLPTAEEVVLSMARKGVNSAGVWDPDEGKASYLVKPDKESPLWKVTSPVIYWWTATEIDPSRSYIIAYDGQVWPRSKDFGPDYLGYRCVKTP